MKVYEFPVYDASPGDNGVIVVVANTLPAAKKAAQAELKRINGIRVAKLQRQVSLGIGQVTQPKFEGVGVVYSYDGEA